MSSSSAGIFLAMTLFECVPFRARYCSSKDSDFQGLFITDVTFVCFCIPVLCQVSISVEQTVVMKFGFTLSEVIFVDSDCLKVLYWLLFF